MTPDLQLEVTRTKPDFIVYVPAFGNESVADTGNEHFLVFDGPDGSLMAVWTQSSAEAQPDQHIVFAQSTNEGVTWSKPRTIAGLNEAGHMASWGFPLVSGSGRIYVLYTRHIGRYDSFFHHTGWIHGIYSDDLGATWSAPRNVPVARSSNDNPDPTMPPNILCWQKPLRLGTGGRYLAGITRWTSFAVRKPVTESWQSADARVEFMRFENVDEDPEPQELQISWFAANEQALAVPYPGHPQSSACQEPSIIQLPDGRLFCVMRTASGSPFWSVSGDAGETWTQPRRLLRQDGGEPLRHPLSPCPLYDLGGEYVLFIHNHEIQDGAKRRPVHLVRGVFRAGADQPVWFGEPEWFMDHTGVGLGKPGTAGRQDLALYSSFTVRRGLAVLWYPDRKFFLLGRRISANPKLAGDRVLAGLHNITPPTVKGTHDADFCIVAGKAYVVYEANDVQSGENPEWPFIYCALTIVDVASGHPEQTVTFAASEMKFVNESLPTGACMVPKITPLNAGTLRTFFASENPGQRESQTWYRDFDLRRAAFAENIYRVELATTEGVFPMQPHAQCRQAIAEGFPNPPHRHGLYMIDSFKRFDGRWHAVLNNFATGIISWAEINTAWTRFTILGSFFQPAAARLSEAAVNRLPDGTWLAIIRQEYRDQNYMFTTSRDGRQWTPAEYRSLVPNGTHSKPTFDRFGDVYYLGWQEATKINGAFRSVFNIEVSRDGRHWERKYRFESDKSFQYPTFRQYDGAIYLTVTQGDYSPSRKERIMFGRLE